MSDLGLIILLAILASIAFIVVALAIAHYHYRLSFLFGYRWLHCLD